MQKEKILNTAIYVRVSTTRQVLEGFSLEAQKENLTQFARTQGWNIYDIYADEGISGKNIQDRKEVIRLIKDIKERKIDIVILYKFDRLTRDSRDTEDFMELIGKYQTVVYTISGGVVDVSTPSGRFNTRILGAAAQYERETTIDRVVDGFIKKVKNGYSLCSYTASYGYDRPKYQQIQTINEKEAEVVKRIFKSYNRGKSFTEIANLLNSENVPTKNQGKIRKKRNSNSYYTVVGIWQAKTIKSILTNPNYIGKVRYGINREQISMEEATDYKNRKKGFITTGLHEPIIDLDTWNKAQSKLKKITKKQRTKLSKEDVYYCGSLICGFCGHPLTTTRTIKKRKNGTKIYNGYRCINREKHLCQALGISHKKVEMVFSNYLEKIADFDNMNVKIIEDKEERKEELANLKKQCIQKDNKEKEIIKLFMEDKIPYNDYKYMKETLENEKKEIVKKTKTLEKSILSKEKKFHKNIPKNIKLYWSYLTNEEKRSFLNQFIEEIVIINKSKQDSFPEILNIKFYKDETF